MTLPFVIFSIIVFEWDETNTDLWKFSAGMLVGPVLASMPLLLWGLGPPLGMTKEEQVTSTETCAFAYAFAGIIGLMGWFYLGYTYAIHYGATDYESFLNALWQDANPSVKFMVVDAVVLWIGMMMLIASKSLSSFLEALLFTPFFGPGAACALALASNEMDHAPRLITNPIEQQKKED
jgi:fumarate reductase subunit D